MTDHIYGTILTRALMDNKELFSECPLQVQKAILLYNEAFNLFNHGDFKEGLKLQDEAFKSLREKKEFEEPEIRRDYIPRRFQELE